MPARTSRSLSDVPLRNLTSFSFATASIAGGRHHDRRGRIKRQSVRLKCGESQSLHFYFWKPLDSERQGSATRPQKQSDPAVGGIPAGSLEVTWEVRVETLEVEIQRGVTLSWEITQISFGFLLLQSTTCSRTNVEPLSRWARGWMFWAERVARVATAPSGTMKKRKDGFSMFALLFGVGVALVMIGIGGEFFRVMSPNVSFVSSRVIFVRRNRPVFSARSLV
jgi:hypothetical protein